MPLPPVTQILSATPPFATVTLDATSHDPATEDSLRLRWRDAEETLRTAGAPDAVVEAIADRVATPTGAAGEHTRVVVASAEGVVLDRVLPGRPARAEATWGPVPSLTALARAASLFVPHALVHLDRSGADLEIVSHLGTEPTEESVDGGHEVLHKVPGGGWSHRRIQSRAEDSWARNASAVAEELDSVHRRFGVDVVLVAGDDHAWSEVEARVSAPVAGRLVRLGTGARAEGTSEDRETDAVRAVLDEHRAVRRRLVLESLTEHRAVAERAAEGLGPVVEALRRGQVEHLVLRDDPTSTRTLWVGTDPLTLSGDADGARAAGASDPQEVRADTALVWALFGSGADLVLVEDDPVDLTDGVGAVLRWSDEATVHAGSR